MPRGATLERLVDWDRRLTARTQRGFRGPRWMRSLRRLDVRVFGDDPDPTKHGRLVVVAQTLPGLVPLGFAIRFAVVSGTGISYLLLGVSVLVVVMAAAVAEGNYRYRARRWVRANNPVS